MGIAAFLLLTVLGCDASEPVAPAPLPDGPSCARSYEAIARSFEQLHADAGKPAPARPDAAAWVKTCDGLALAGPVLRCLEPSVAAAEVAECAPILGGVDREPLDKPFREAMLRPPGASQ